MKTPNPKPRTLWIGLATAGALAAGGLLESIHTRRIARDPENEALKTTPKGRPRSRGMQRSRNAELSPLVSRR